MEGRVLKNSSSKPRRIWSSLGAAMTLLAVFPAFAAGRADAAPEEPLEALLAKTGASEARKAASHCAFTEDGVVEQLSSEGKSEGKVFRRYETTVKNATIVTRKLTSKKVEGDPSSFLVKEHENRGDAEYTAFHPTQQPLYRFSQEGAEGNRVKVRFTPREPHEKRLRGTAWIDRETGLLAQAEAGPSEKSGMLQEFRLSFEQVETPCGPQATHVVIQGKGGLLFFTLRFRSETNLSGHRLVSPSAK